MTRACRHQYLTLSLVRETGSRSVGRGIDIDNPRLVLLKSHVGKASSASSFLYTVNLLPATHPNNQRNACQRTVISQLIKCDFAHSSSPFNRSSISSNILLLRLLQRGSPLPKSSVMKRRRNRSPWADSPLMEVSHTVSRAPLTDLLLSSKVALLIFQE